MKLSRRTTHNVPSLQLSLTSMVDVVFLLLVFFLTTTTIVLPQQDLETVITSRDNKASESQTELEPAIIRVSKEGEEVVYRFGAVSTNQLDRIREMLRNFSYKQGGAFVEFEASIEYGVSASLISACKEAGFKPVTWICRELSQDQ